MSLLKTVEHQYSPIMAAIYGSQIDVLPRSGLTDAEDEGDIILKLESLKASGKKQPLVFTNGFEKLGHSNSRAPLLCLQDKVLVLKDASIPAYWNWSTSFRRWGLRMRDPKRSCRCECRTSNGVRRILRNRGSQSHSWFGQRRPFLRWSHEVELLESREAASAFQPLS